jgi:hypothetical protein
LPASFWILGHDFVAHSHLIDPDLLATCQQHGYIGGEGVEQVADFTGRLADAAFFGCVVGCSCACRAEAVSR